MLQSQVHRLRLGSGRQSSNTHVSTFSRRCITLIPAYQGDTPAPGGSNGDSENQRRSKKGDNFSKASRRRGREAHLRSPYDTPLRDGNRDRLIGLLTERAAKTLMVYLMETNVMLHNWLVSFYKENAIPKIGAWDEVSGESFLRKLLAMPISSARLELGRDSLFDNSAECGVDPRSMAQRIMEIRTQLAAEFVQDLSGVAEENSSLLRETLRSSLMGELAVHPTVPFNASSPPIDTTSADSTTSSSNGNGGSSNGNGVATKPRPSSANEKPRGYDPGEGRRKHRPLSAGPTDHLKHWRLEAMYNSSSDEDGHPIEDVPHLKTPQSFQSPGSGPVEPPTLPPQFVPPPPQPPYKAFMDAAAAETPGLFSSTDEAASDEESKKPKAGEAAGSTSEVKPTGSLPSSPPTAGAPAAPSPPAAAAGEVAAPPPPASPAAADSSSGGSSLTASAAAHAAAAEAAFAAPAAEPSPVSPPRVSPPALSGSDATVAAAAAAEAAFAAPSATPASSGSGSNVSAPPSSASTPPTTPPARKRGPPTEKQLAMMHPEIAEMLRNNTGDWQDLYPDIAAVLEQEAAIVQQPSPTTKPDPDAPPPPSPDTPLPKA